MAATFGVGPDQVAARLFGDEYTEPEWVVAINQFIRGGSAMLQMLLRSSGFEIDEVELLGPGEGLYDLCELYITHYAVSGCAASGTQADTAVGKRADEGRAEVKDLIRGYAASLRPNPVRGEVGGLFHGGPATSIQAPSAPSGRQRSPFVRAIQNEGS